MGLEVTASSIIITDRSGNEKFNSNDKLTYLSHVSVYNGLVFSTSTPTLNAWNFWNNIPDKDDDAYVVCELEILSVTGNSELASLIGKTIPFNGVIPLSMNVNGGYELGVVFAEALTSYMSLTRFRWSDGSNDLQVGYFAVRPYGDLWEKVSHDVTFNFTIRVYSYT